MWRLNESAPKLTPSLLQNYQKLSYRYRDGTNVGSDGVQGDLASAAQKMKDNVGAGKAADLDAVAWLL